MVELDHCENKGLVGVCKTRFLSSVGAPFIDGAEVACQMGFWDSGNATKLVEGEK